MNGGETQGIVIPVLVEKDAASVDELDDHILLLEAARHRLEVEWTESLGVFEGREGHRALGYPSPVAYLKHRARMTASRANRYVVLARAARRFKATLASWKHRQISTDQAEMLFQASKQQPDKYPDAETVLLEIIGDTPEETRKVLDYWRDTVDRPGVVADYDTQLLRRRFDYTHKPNGMIEGEFALTETAGEELITALDAAMSPPSEDDERTATQRRHDAFADMARGFLEGTSTSEVGGEKPHVNILVDVDALEGVPGGVHETETGRVLNIETIRLLTCDSSISRIVWNGPSEILDVGRRTRIIPTALRRAVIARDRHCTWQGCTRSPRWCDVHHIVSWADGGETVLTNLCLLCRYHHTLIHRYEGDPNDKLDLRILQPVTQHRPI
jgi:hypothetical protein